MPNRCFRFLALLALLSAVPAAALEMRGETIYLMLPDRFFDGDVSNNTAVDPSLYDATKTDWQKFWGGDLAGLKQKLDYLDAVGVTTVWTTPVYQNHPSIGTYHGYQMQDLFRVDPHHGTFSAMDALTCDMHGRGMKFMLDISLNSGPATAAGSACLLKKDGTVVARYTDDVGGWFHHYGPIDFGNASYWDQVNKDIFGLADLNQDTAAVRDYLKQGAALWQYHGVDCFRLDAAKHFEPSFGSEWMSSGHQVANWLRKPGTYAVGEWYGGGAWNSESLWWIQTAGTALFDFQLHEELRAVTGEWATMYELRDVLYSRHMAYGQAPGGTSYVHWQVNFFDSHDTQRLIIPLLQKYGYANLPEVKERIAMALGLLEMVPGIPMVFYGTEQYLHVDTVNGNGIAGGDPYNRPMMQSFDPNTLAARVLSKASDLRRVSPAVQYGNIEERWISSGLFVFSREAAGSAVLVGVNNGWQSQTVTVTGIPFPDATYEDVLGITAAISVEGGAAAVTVPARSTVIFSYLPNPLTPAIQTDTRCSMPLPNQSGLPPSGQIVIDGENIRADFAGKLRATQINPTGFGDAGPGAGGSEIDQLLAANDGSSLLVGLTGNLEQNQNALLLFIDSGVAVDSVLTATAGPGVVSAIRGSRMDDGFTPAWLLVINAVPSNVWYADLVNLAENTSEFLGAGEVNGPASTLAGGAQIAFNNTNTGGVTGATVLNANTANTGFEIRLPFDLIKLRTGSVKLLAAVAGPSGYFSNQSLPGMGLMLPGCVGGYQNLGNGPVDFGKVAGTQYSTVALQNIAYQQFGSNAPVRMLPAGSPVSISGQVGTGAFAEPRSFYMQDAANYSGIRVLLPSGTLAQLGQAVSVTGFTGVEQGEPVIYATGVVLGGAAPVPEAVGVRNRDLGGGATNGFTGVEGGVGLANVGINARIWGCVTSTGTDSSGNAFFYLDDGSGASDGAAVGVRVYTSFTLPPAGAYAMAKGVSSVEEIAGKIRPCLLTRQPSDVTILF